MPKVYRSDKKRELVYSTYDRLLERWGVAYEEKMVEGAFGQTYVIEAGPKEAPPLLLLHGVGDNSALMWVYNIQALSSAYRCIAVDIIGSGGKSLPGGRYFERGRFSQCQWMAELLDTLGLKRVDAVGVSYGCYLVQLLKTELPERFGRVVGLAGGPAVGEGGSPMRSMLVFLPEALFPTDRNIFRLLGKLTGDEGKAFRENPPLLAHWSAVLRGFNNMTMARHPVLPIARERYGPTREDALFILGDRDVIGYSQAAVDMFESLGQRCLVIEGAGHSVNHEAAPQVNAAILDFLRRD